MTKRKGKKRQKDGQTLRRWDQEEVTKCVDIYIYIYARFHISSKILEGRSRDRRTASTVRLVNPN